MAHSSPRLRLRNVERGEVPCLPAIRRRHLATGRVIGPAPAVQEPLIRLRKRDRDVFPSCGFLVIFASSLRTSQTGWGVAYSGQEQGHKSLLRTRSRCRIWSRGDLCLLCVRPDVI